MTARLFRWALLCLVVTAGRTAWADAPTIDPLLIPTSVPRESAARPLSDSWWIDRFDAPAGTDLRKLGWQGGQSVSGKRDHELVLADGRTVLRSRYLVGTEAKYLFKEVEWDTNTFPWLRWRWRVIEFPKNARVLDKSVSDAGAQVYILWKIGRRNRVLKYFWSVGDKLGDILSQSHWIFGRLYGLVIRTEKLAGTWRTEARNVREDYKTAFGEYPSEKARGIAVLSDGDETKSEATAEFADFEALRHAPVSPSLQNAPPTSERGAGSRGSASSVPSLPPGS